ncbi:bacterioferritin-associated ferredoxin [Litorimonas taeanensis]|uniref:Bacterioferritin-associated ferredoxin n=1 Tax=Litorimonas taeanensis TaxID=568099 RepID=A0A420WEY5_9PROT|nr:bacterioferritin-associated ferredoxin [Litorimonas taeanensis]
MIYCVCRQINTEKVDFAACNGAKTARCVLAHYGERFNCGKCASSIQERLDAKLAPALPIAAE